ncbi:MAG: nitronate monooxygenase [Kiritimatiellae bacterium]|nr:nitronate monooxygenase [Kiritimatiellia bacterium]
MKTDLLDKLWKRGREFLGVRHPIMCGAMTWISDYQLVKAISDNGGFGVLAGGNLPPDLFEQEIDRCVAGVQGPFAVNLITIAPNFQAHKEVLRKKEVPFVVFAGNFPKRQDVVEMKESGKKTLAFASTMSIADQMVRFGIDGLILEGSEAGGHIGHDSLVILLQQVLFEQPTVPVFTAGGIGTGKMMAHLLLMGAAGIQMGTRFVVSEECRAHPQFKQRFIRGKSREAIETPQYDKRLPIVAVRALRNKSSEEFGRLQIELITKLDAGTITRQEAQFEVEHFWIGGLRKAVVEGDVETGSVMAGQSVGLVDRIQPMKEIFRELIEDAEFELERVRDLLPRQTHTGR